MTLRYAQFNVLAPVGWLFAPMCGLCWAMLGVPLVFGVLLALFGVLGLWRRGVTFDLESRTVCSWSGPLLPLFQRRFELKAFSVVSLMEGSHEVPGNEDSPNGFHNFLVLKLQTPGGAEDPHDPTTKPVVVSVRRYEVSDRDRGLAEGTTLAEKLGLPFRADVPETGAVPPSFEARR